MNITRRGRIEVITNQSNGEVEYVVSIKVAGKNITEIYYNYDDAEKRRKELHATTINKRTESRREKRNQKNSTNCDNKLDDVIKRINDISNIITFQAAKIMDINKKLDNCIEYYKDAIKRGKIC